MANKYSPHTASSLLMLKIELHNSKLESAYKHPDEWITNLEWLRIHLTKIRMKGDITDEDFVIQTVNNFLRNMIPILTVWTIV